MGMIKLNTLQQIYLHMAGLNFAFRDVNNVKNWTNLFLS